MNYEIVTLEEKNIVGLTARTANTAPDMGSVIGGLWRQFFENGLFSSIADKANNFAVGLYSNYSGDAHEEYDITVGCEVTQISKSPTGMVKKVIPQGDYAKFVVFGDQVKAVAGAWTEIWAMPLSRSYTGDFEEYVSTDGNGNCEVHIYVALQSK
ncbi:GyrI-like domain-containing protein [Oscillospiraceae bacterium LTW-04]|nr:GyrI-like domain-containing protein [Oscillospiraceae bacterium MB24-C1]